MSDHALGGCERLPLLGRLAQIEGSGVLHTDGGYDRLPVFQYDTKKTLYRRRETLEFTGKSTTCG